MPAQDEAKLPPEIREMVHQGKMVSAIQKLGELRPQMPLIDRKSAVEDYRKQRAARVGKDRSTDHRR